MGGEGVGGGCRRSARYSGHVLGVCRRMSSTCGLLGVCVRSWDEQCGSYRHCSTLRPNHSATFDLVYCTDHAVVVSVIAFVNTVICDAIAVTTELAVVMVSSLLHFSCCHCFL